MKNLTKREISGLIIIGIGIVEILSGLFINPWISNWWDYSHRRWYNDYRNVVFFYYLFSLGLGALAVFLGAFIAKRKIRLVDNLAISFLLLSFVVLSDRLLLIRYGLSIWVADSELHFKYRPNAVRYWPKVYTRGILKPVVINRHGFHDDDFPVEKEEGEFRALVLGDSIAMGHGVSRHETFSNQLERDLAAKSTKYKKHQIINAAVEGYSTYQYYKVFKQALVFKPDIVFVGFCMNDLTEPFIINRDLGGTGFGNQGITQFKHGFLGYLFHETGFGRWIQASQQSELLRKNYKLEEVYNVKYMIAHLQDDPKIKKAWDIVLSDLDKIYDLGKRENIKVVLLIFPYTFQLVKDDQTITPQIILSDHARSHHVPVFDFTTVFRHILLEYAHALVEKRLPPQAINKMSERYLLEYFLDWDHLTARGHKVVANVLFGYLTEKVFRRGEPF